MKIWLLFCFSLYVIANIFHFIWLLFDFRHWYHSRLVLIKNVWIYASFCLLQDMAVNQLHTSTPSVLSFFLLSSKYVNVHLISRFVKNICWYIHLFTTMMRSTHTGHNKIYNFKRLPTKTCSAFNYIMRKPDFFYYNRIKEWWPIILIDRALPNHKVHFDDFWVI